MDEKNLKDLAYRAWLLYKQLFRILNMLNETFWNEFSDLDEKEYRRKTEEKIMPF